MIKRYYSIAIALFVGSLSAFAQPGGSDPQSCYEPNSAVYDCTMIGVNDGYDDGYADGYAEGAASCVADTVTVVICDYISYANAIEQMADTIANLYAMIEYLENQLADCSDAVQWNFDLIQQQDSVLLVVEDEVLYWMENYYECVSDCNAALDECYDSNPLNLHCATDFDNNGTTGATDLLYFLSQWEVQCD